MHSERNANHAQHNVIKAIAIFVTVAFLLNAMAPTLSYAAIDLAEVNAYTLVRDAYVAVTYYDSTGKQKLAKGWVDAVGETSFTIREGGFLGKKTIAYDKVESVIMSDESTVPAKQMNEVNRFPREKNREIERAKTLLLNAMAPTLAHAATYLQGAEVNANTLVRDAYVQVTYRYRNGQEKTERGWIDAVGETSFTIFGKETIAYDKVLSVIMSDESTVPAKQVNEVNRFIRNMNARKLKNEQAYNQTNEDHTTQLLNQKTVATKVRVQAPSVLKRRTVGRLVKMKQDTLVIQGDRRFYEVPRSSISNLEVSIGQHRDERDIGIGLLIGVGLGIIIYVTQSPECPDPPTCTFAGLEELRALILAGGTVMILTLIGAKKSEKWVEVSLERLNLSLSPTSTTGLHAALTFNF